MKVALIAGGNRLEATSTQVLRYIQHELTAQQHEVELVDLYVTPIPFYSTDENHADAATLRLKRVLKEADAIVLGTPEYHGSMSGVLKNALDHVSSEEFDGKAVLVVSSAGGAVGTSSLLQLQAIVRNLHGINCPEWISVGGDARTFDSEGIPADDKVKTRILRTLHYFIDLSANLRQ
ncbi:hypothetical protein SY83_20665 [Paenibacillus swuensis]|uniref:NADPH-dependent FMN reductase-like domain-containing protein n=1 Tax=Paenibacillus swuensis TaxID=1178515 RepID=A0A172TMJ5_9BACL|nr:NADPH-dependent FMN reductase [Paenibacillus swuensis]ANE48299.1 hypothetical protein SY83_20665 [Paenibacillus swuensis]